MAASTPAYSHTEYAVDSGRIDAARIDAPISPTAKRREAASPASGCSATAASAASVMLRPSRCRVAAHATTTKKPMTPVSTAPVITSMRSSLRSSTRSFLSTA